MWECASDCSRRATARTRSATPIVREVLDASTGSPRRALLHREAARVLSRPPGSDPLLVAHHARLSGAQALASSALIAASRIAADRFDYATALDLATEAIDAGDTTDARIQRAIVLLRLTRFEEAQADAERAIETRSRLASARGRRIGRLLLQGFRPCGSARAALIEQASDASQRVQGQVIRARALHAMGDVAGADDLMEQAMARICREHRLRQPDVRVRLSQGAHGRGGARDQRRRGEPARSARRGVHDLHARARISRARLRARDLRPRAAKRWTSSSARPRRDGGAA